MLWLIFLDGGLRSVSTDRTDASIQANQLIKDGEGSHVRIVAVTGSVAEEIHKDDREEA